MHKSSESQRCNITAISQPIHSMIEGDLSFTELTNILEKSLFNDIES